MKGPKQMPRKWVVNVILSGLAAFGIFSTSIYLPSLPALVHDFQSDQASVQLTLTAFFLGASMGQLLLGPLADYFGRLKVAYWGIAIFMIATVAGTFTDSISFFIFWRLVQGVAGATGPLLSRAIARDIFSGQDLTRMLSKVMMVISVSPAIAPIIGGYLQVHFGWHYAFYFLSLAAGLVLLLIILFMPETSPSLKENEIRIIPVLKVYLKLFDDVRFLSYGIVLSGIFAGLFVFITMSPFIFIKQFGWGPEEYAWVSAMITVGNVGGFAIANRLAGHRNPNKLILNGLYLTIGSAIYLILVSLLGWVNDIHVLIFIVLYLGCSSIAIANCSSLSMNLHPKAAGAAAAVIGSIQIGSGAVGSAIAGTVPDFPLTMGLCMGGLASISLGTFLYNLRYKFPSNL